MNPRPPLTSPPPSHFLFSIQPPLLGHVRGQAGRPPPSQGAPARSRGPLSAAVPAPSEASMLRR
eukprot:scaffold13881_cov124-Isochrysis_galbana.AAC.8